MAILYNHATNSITADSGNVSINGSVPGGGGASATKTIANKTAAYTVIAADLGKIINCTANTFTISLTAAATLGSGFTCSIWNTSDTTADTITIDPNLSETIDVRNTLILHCGEGVDIVCNGTNWYVGNKKPMRGYSENITSSTIYRPNASGSFGSIALGTNCNVSGGSSFGFGGNTEVQGGGAIAIGGYYLGASGVRAYSNFSSAIGSNSAGNGSFTETNGGAMALGGSYTSGADGLSASISDNTNTYGSKGSNSFAQGYLSKATGAYSIAMGNSCSATGDYSIAIGWQNTAGNRSYCIGGYNSTAGDNSVVLGSWGSNIQNAYSTAIGGGKAWDNNIQNKWCFSSNGAAVVGGGQYGIFVLTGSTTNATPTILITNNDGVANAVNHIVLPNNSCHAFSALVVARQSAGAGTASAAWKYEGLIRREGTASTVILVSSTPTVISNVPGWVVTLSANTTYGSLVFTVTGAASTNIRWVATVSTSEVINA